MKRVILSFGSKQDVIEFLAVIQADHLEYSLKNNIVICSCTREEIEIATSRFGAEVDELQVHR